MEYTSVRGASIGRVQEVSFSLSMISLRELALMYLVSAAMGPYTEEQMMYDFYRAG